MNGFFKDIKEDKILLRGSILTLSVVFLSFISIGLFYSKLPPFLPLFNQMPWGEERIQKTVWIFIVPGIALIIFAINLIFEKFIYKKIPLMARIFSITALLISILGFLFIFRTINIVL
ncbi:MAG: hypothetical protein AAB931_00625 [Patescibacteria group bacterium]